MSEQIIFFIKCPFNQCEHKWFGMVQGFAGCLESSNDGWQPYPDGVGEDIKDKYEVDKILPSRCGDNF